MPPVQLKGGYYEARSIIANAQRCVNLYPEKNPEDSPSPHTMYLTPGLTTLVQGAVGPWRSLYAATNGNLYGVLGQNVYYIDNSWVLHLLGQLILITNLPVGMKDNGVDLVLADGSSSGYTIHLADNTFSALTDPDYLGSNIVDYLDTFMLFNEPATRNFYSTLSNQTNIDPTYIAAKSGFPDPLVSLIVMHREIWLLGSLTSEVWYNAGNPGFPFAITPGVFIEHGCAATYSVAKHDLMIFWLSRDKDGQATVYEGSNYAAVRISTPAIAQRLSRLPTISDAIGMTYKQQDHIFYVLTFPAADCTFVYDASEKLWHERVYTDTNGAEHRHRANCMSFAYGTNVAGDFANGKLYKLDLDNFTDDSAPIVRRRGFPHILNDGKRASYQVFRADMECGGVQGVQLPIGPAFSAGFSSGFGPGTSFALGQVYLRWSDNRGRSWGTPVGQDIGATGDFIRQMQWRNLGMARDRVFELFWAAPEATALQGAWIDVTPASS